MRLQSLVVAAFVLLAFVPELTAQEAQAFDTVYIDGVPLVRRLESKVRQAQRARTPKDYFGAVVGCYRMLELKSSATGHETWVSPASSLQLLSSLNHYIDSTPRRNARWAGYEMGSWIRWDRDSIIVLYPRGMSGLAFRLGQDSDGLGGVAVPYSSDSWTPSSDSAIVRFRKEDCPT